MVKEFTDYRNYRNELTVRAETARNELADLNAQLTTAQTSMDEALMDGAATSAIQKSLSQLTTQVGLVERRLGLLHGSPQASGELRRLAEAAWSAWNAEMEIYRIQYREAMDEAIIARDDFLSKLSLAGDIAKRSRRMQRDARELDGVIEIPVALPCLGRDARAQLDRSVIRVADQAIAHSEDFI